MLRERRIDKKTVYRALTITTLGLGVVICTTLVMVFNTPGRGGMIDGNLVDCLYEAASAFGTVGLSVGVTGQLSALGKVATALTMLIGRVGPISMGMTLAARRMSCPAARCCRRPRSWSADLARAFRQISQNVGGFIDADDIAYYHRGAAFCAAPIFCFAC